MNAKRILTIALTLALSAAAWAQAKPADKAAEKPSDKLAAAPEEGVALTVYNGGFGVIRETRSLDIGKGGIVKFVDVASAIDATTVHFKSLTDPAAKLMEQNYQFDLVSADKLLKKYVDQPIRVITKSGEMYRCKLLSFDQAQLVLQDDDGGLSMIQRADNVRDIQFGKLPEGLLTRPTLVWLVQTAKPGKQLVEVTYQTGGLGWHAEYVLVLDDKDASGDLSGWVSVQNNSGKAYDQARMKFIAGDVRRIEPPVAAQAELSTVGGSEAEAPMQEKAFFEYHMYTLPGVSTVADNEVKQLEMFPPAQGIKVVKRFLYNPNRGWRWTGSLATDEGYGVTSDKKVNVFIEFKNSKENNLGIPLPGGKVRVYKQDPSDKALEFIGEEQIDHTPKDEELSLQIGNAFDIVGERRQTNFRVESGRNWMTESFEIKLRNHKKEDVVVRVKEPLYRWNTGKIVQTNYEGYQKLDAFNAAWDLPVKADGETVLTYTVEYTW